MSNYILRPYQREAVKTAVSFFLGDIKGNALEVLPTGSGKSLIIANIVKELDAPVLIFQPSKEILEQNYDKLTSYGYEAGIYSASMGQKNLRNVTYATIGSVVRKPDMLRDFKYIICDECHYVNSKAGMYRDLFKVLDGVRILGLTATPYRLVTDGYGGSILKFLTRTRPRVFEHLIYYIQNDRLFKDGYLAKLQYVNKGGFDKAKLRINTTGADYTDQSVQQYFKEIDFGGRVSEVVHNLSRIRKSVLVFTRFTREAERLVREIPGSAIVTAETPKKEREVIITAFRSGDIPVVCNVGVLTHGFDYPELDTVVMARPTMSLALYYQMIGRAIRIHPDKEQSLIVDMCDNYRMFGPIERLKLVNTGNEKWVIVSNGRQLTNIYYGEGFDQKQKGKKGGHRVFYARNRRRKR